MAKTTITARADGPYDVCGGATIYDAKGNMTEVPEEKIVSLCRCGHSKNKPFCDGTHRICGFKDPEE